MITSWRSHIASTADQLMFPFAGTLDLLEELLAGKLPQTSDKYSYLAKLLDNARDEGLITWSEYQNIRSSLVGVNGFL